MLDTKWAWESLSLSMRLLPILSSSSKAFAHENWTAKGWKLHEKSRTQYQKEELHRHLRNGPQMDTHQKLCYWSQLRLAHRGSTKLDHPSGVSLQFPLTSNLCLHCSFPCDVCSMPPSHPAVGCLFPVSISLSVSLVP